MPALGDCTTECSLETASREELLALIAQLRYEVDHDHLTGLPNRRFFERRLSEHLMALTSTGVRAPGALLVFDLDNFKQYNDGHGHLYGDAVLQLVGRTVNANLRTTDFLARLSGDEFVVLLPSLTLLQAEEAATKLLAVVAETTGATITIGATEFNPLDDAMSVFHRADRALYAAKQAGRNCFRSLRP